MATAVAVGPASANEDIEADKDRASAAPEPALRSTGAQVTAGPETHRLDPASISAAVSTATRSSSSSAADEIDAERLALAVRDLTNRSGAEAKASTERSSGEPAKTAAATAKTVAATATAPAETTTETNAVAGTTAAATTKPVADSKPAATAIAATDDAEEEATTATRATGILPDDTETNMGPMGSLRSFTTTYGAPPLLIPALEGVTDPEGDPFELVDAFIIEGVGTLEIDGTMLRYTPPSEPVLNPFAGIDLFYVDSHGASGVGHIFIEILPPMEPVCEEVELFTEELLVNREEGSTAFIIPEAMLGCEYYELELISTDGLHEPGYQTDQTRESWFIEGIGLFADVTEIVYTSPPTPDLADDETAAAIYLPAISPKKLGIRGWQLRHVGEGGVNSVSATLRLIPSGPPPPPLPPGCEPVIVFEDVRLLNRAGDSMASVPFTPPTCSLPLVTIALVSTDFGHQPGFQPEQDEEYWSLEAYDVDGNFLFHIEGPDDLADDEHGDAVYAEGVDLSDVAEFRIVHDASGDGINSVDASVYIFFDDI